MKKGIIKIITLMQVLALPIVFLTGCDTSTVEQDYAQAYVSVKINPEVEMAVDSEGNVEAVYCVNEDAEVLLSETELVGMNVEEAVETIVEEATEAGYIDIEGQDNEVEIGVITDEESEESAGLQQKIQTRLKERIHKYFDNNGIFGVVSQATLDEYAQQAAELGVSMGKTKMILRALELNPLLDINQLKDLPMKELAQGLSKKVKERKIDAGLREEFQSDVDELISEYPELLTLRQEIQAIKAQLEAFEGSEEDKAVLEQSLEQKQTELETLRGQVEAEIEDLHEAYKEECEQKKEQHKAQAEQRREANRQKVQEHRKNVNRTRVKEIQQWRKNKQK